MPDGGSLAITARVKANAAVLQWSDDGVGMSEDIRRRAFEPFVTTHAGGTGLGLAVVYAAVQDHGGSIVVASKPGDGTTVRVELPYHEEV